tara:strand:- start:2148 stop:2330 length:183 start_codon:yes stop_codon:yes gene_type:complete
MKSHFKILALALLITGCSALENKRDDLLKPPNVLDQLYCESETMTACDGFLTQKDIIKEK